MNLRFRLFATSLLSLSAALCGTSFLSTTAKAQPVQGLYVTGSGGASFNQDQVVRLNPIMPGGRDKYSTGATAVTSLGYGLGNGFRIEVEGNYRNNPLKYQNLGTYKARGEGRQQTYGVMVNALFDMDIGNPYIFPYFGAGIGYGWSTMNGVKLHTSDNRLTEHLGGTFGNFSYQAIGGLSFPTPWVVGLSFITEYRFWTMLAPQSHTADVWGTQGGYNTTHSYSYNRGNRDTTTYFNHSIMLGLRYEFNPAPPPSTTIDKAPTVPESRKSRTYLVFFAWDSYDLNDRSRSIVKEAAQAYNSVRTTRIEADGYTDTSSAPNERGKRYNIALSLKRAKMIKAELIKNGVPATDIDIHGYGSDNPLVKTGPNVREPQNRRVEIILH
ncbi:OmpA family protein [Commensalibacter oyaizuii]|uniref:OmpA family protein n=1 Tax=Commensalibacter oyaizuii TaxID=3043873 RepID=A0ABT6Q086_9PROT|nr:OmpA family protein [Commensalibacter sp. TBRC 16381]MDI2090526.1 OmpA family protein [Commensalibacter sp. TBRC 16381]